MDDGSSGTGPSSPFRPPQPTILMMQSPYHGLITSYSALEFCPVSWRGAYSLLKGLIPSGGVTLISLLLNLGLVLFSPSPSTSGSASLVLSHH